MSKFPFERTELVCLNCGNLAVIQRKKRKLKKEGHIKTFYCPVCKNVSNHYEVRDASAFLWKHIDSEIMDIDTKTAIDYLKMRVDINGKEDRISKKVLTRR